MRKYCYILFLLGTLQPAAVFAQVAVPATIQVFDDGRKPAADATIIVIETREKVFTDARGRADISVPGTGYYTLRVVLADGRLVQPRVNVTSAGQTLDVFAGSVEQQEDPGAGDIQVVGRGDEQKLSRHRLRLDEIKRIPGQFGEALRGIETLPGVITPAFGNGEISIRGADEGSNTYLVDDLPIGYPFHFMPTNSVLHNDLIKNIDVFTGSYPANYGNATGGIIDIETIDEVERFGGHASFSLWSANALFKSPIPSLSEEDESAGYWMAAARGSYLDKTLSSLAPDGIRLPVYWDAQFKSRFDLAEGHSIYLYALAAKDTFGAEIDEEPEYDPTKEVDPVFVGAAFAADQAFHTEAIRYQWSPGSKLRTRFTLLYTENLRFIDAKVGDITFRQDLEDGYGSFRGDLDWEVVRNHVRVEAGGEARVFNYRNQGTTVRLVDPNDESPELFSTPSDFVTVPVRDSVVTQYNSGYGMIVLDGYGFEFKPGFRVEHFGQTEQTVVDPKGTLAYTLPFWKKNPTTLLGGGGVYHRLPEPYEFSPSSGNPDLRFERAEHYSGGIQQEIADWLFKVEVFRHYFRDLVVVDPYLTLPYRLNQDAFDRYEEPIIYNAPAVYSNDGTGFSEGFELYLKKSKPPRKNGFYGWASYTWSRSLRNTHQHIITDEERRLLRSPNEFRLIAQYDNNRDGYADFDRTHIINLVLGYQYDRDWQFGLRWQYRTAQPYTPIVGDDGGQQQNRGRRIFDPEYSKLTNSKRLSDYHRLDFRVDRFFHYEWGFGNIFFEVLNVYARRNEETVQWDNARPWSATNPEVQYDFLLLEQDVQGEKVSIPFFNIGIEVQF